MKTKREGFTEAPESGVTWCFGHLLEMASPNEAGRLQGWPEVAETMLRESQKGRIFPQRFIVHCLGKGVPNAMGTWIAKQVLSLYGSESGIEQEGQAYQESLQAFADVG